MAQIGYDQMAPDPMDAIAQKIAMQLADATLTGAQTDTGMPARNNPPGVYSRQIRQTPADTSPDANWTPQFRSDRDAYISRINKAGAMMPNGMQAPTMSNQEYQDMRQGKMKEAMARMVKPSTIAGSGGGTFEGSSGKTIVPQAGAENINFWKQNPGGASPGAVEAYKNKLLPSNWLYKQEMGEIPIQGPLQPGQAQQTKMGPVTVPSTWQDLMANKDIVQDAVGQEGYAGLMTSGQTLENNQKLMNALVKAGISEAVAEKMIPLIQSQMTKPADTLNRDKWQAQENDLNNYVDNLISRGLVGEKYDQWLMTESALPTGQQSSLFSQSKTLGDSYGDKFNAEVASRIATRLKAGGGQQPQTPQTPSNSNSPQPTPTATSTPSVAPTPAASTTPQAPVNDVEGITQKLKAGGKPWAYIRDTMKNGGKSSEEIQRAWTAYNSQPQAGVK